LLCTAGSKKVLFHLTAKNDIAAGSELVTTKLCRLAIDVENTPVLKNPAELSATEFFVLSANFPYFY